MKTKNFSKNMKNVGFHSDRMNDKNFSDRERAFASAWENENDPDNWAHPPIIGNIIPDLTERDRRVAATIIQWLGTNCGMSFLADVMKSETKIREFFGGQP